MRTVLACGVVTAAAVTSLSGCGKSAPSAWDQMAGLSAKQLADRMNCKPYSENDGPFDPTEPPHTIPVAACFIDYTYPADTVTIHVYPSRAAGAEVRKMSENLNGKGSSAWAGNILLVFQSANAQKTAGAYAALSQHSTILL